MRITRILDIIDDCIVLGENDEITFNITQNRKTYAVLETEDEVCLSLKDSPHRITWAQLWNNCSLVEIETDKGESIEIWCYGF